MGKRGFILTAEKTASRMDERNTNTSLEHNRWQVVEAKGTSSWNRLRNHSSSVDG
jgi:hypothetical protein